MEILSLKAKHMFRCFEDGMSNAVGIWCWHTISLPSYIMYKCIHFHGYKVHNNQFHHHRNIYLLWRSNGKDLQLILLSECETDNARGGECSEKAQRPWTLKHANIQFVNRQWKQIEYKKHESMLWCCFLVHLEAAAWH